MVSELRRCQAGTTESVLESNGPRKSLELSKVQIGLETTELQRTKRKSRPVGRWTRGRWTGVQRLVWGLYVRFLRLGETGVWARVQRSVLYNDTGHALECVGTRSPNRMCLKRTLQRTHTVSRGAGADAFGGWLLSAAGDEAALWDVGAGRAAFRGSVSTHRYRLSIQGTLGVREWVRLVSGLSRGDDGGCSGAPAVDLCSSASDLSTVRIGLLNCTVVTG